MITLNIITITKYIIYPVVIGIVSTVCYVLIFDEIFKKTLLPWYFSRKYKSTLICGKWKGESNNFAFEVTISQRGDRVWGEMFVQTITIKTDSKTGNKEKVIHTSNSYVFEGEIKDGFVRISHREKDRNSFGFGCFLFKIAGGGKMLIGSVVYVNESRTALNDVKTENNLTLRRESAS